MNSEILQYGLQALYEYLSLHVLTCLIPAFFMAGAISALFSKESVLKYLGPDAPKPLAYSIASISGVLLAVCSCTVLPLFAGIYRRGAGIGPATTFLYSAPAINLLAIVYTARVLGYDIGAARAVLAVLFSILIGIAMSLIWKEESSGTRRSFTVSRESAKTPVLLALLLLILILGGAHLESSLKILSLSSLVFVTSIFSVLNFTRDELMNWMRETWFLIRQILPLLLFGVFLTGIVVNLIPPEIVSRYVGGNSLESNLIASVAAALTYFSTLLEVPIVGELMKLGMGRGPALAMLLAGPAVSLPNMLTLSRIMGLKKTASYIALIILTSTFSGMLFGALG
ncbi:MAG: uncharacterized protein PWR13_979 [Archaeoglobi archaeon]|nr:permease [Candidatus Mnemosynella bozhongmuii]MDI3502259.1 uncharacterized protein [Archaeoglobi archaeon]MDK2781951.1 uncharacterized protein [Archaeoglobi archaeon]